MCPPEERHADRLRSSRERIIKIIVFFRILVEIQRRDLVFSYSTSSSLWNNKFHFPTIHLLINEKEVPLENISARKGQIGQKR